jgi:hypothetical protein
MLRWTCGCRSNGAATFRLWGGFIASAVEEKVVGLGAATPAHFHGGRDEDDPYIG